MDLLVSKRLPKRKLTATERYLGVQSHVPLPTTTTADDLHEDDVVFLTAEYYTELNHDHINHNNSSSNHSSTTSSAIPNHHHHRKAHPFAGPDSFGILAVLPENVTSANNLRNSVQHFHNKASVSSAASSLSSSSSSSSASFSSSMRAIAAIPRLPQHHHDRFFSSSLSSLFNHPMSAPVDVPMMSAAAVNFPRRRHKIEDEDSEDHEEGGERLPPHEMVAKKEARTPVLSCSVLEGAGRTLKGRDLRMVRSAVWRQTGFTD